MRLYSLFGATAIDAPEGHFEPGDDGSWDNLPGAVFERLRNSAVSGRRLWEDEIERSARLHGEEAARRRDPESLYSSMGDLTQAMTQLARIQGSGPARPQSREEELAALRERLAELEGSTPHPAPADSTSEASGAESEPGATAETAPKPDEVKVAPKPGSRAAVKDKPPAVK